MNQAQPKLSTREIVDIYSRNNFEQLNSYFATQNQLKDFRFFDLSFTAAARNTKVAHGFAFVPQDVIVTKIVGAGTVTFNHGLFSNTQLDLTVTGACRVRFFVGQYWNYETSAGPSQSDASSYQATTPGTSAAAAATTPSTLSQLILNTGNGFGSTNTAIRRYGAVESLAGLGFSYEDSAVDGMALTILAPGIWQFSCQDALAGGSTEIGISLNSAELTTNVNAILLANRLGFMTSAGAGLTGNVSAAVYCRANDVIRAHGDGTADATTTARFSAILLAAI